MRKSATEILVPTVRRDVLAAMLLHPKKSWYLSELALYIGAAPSHLHRELAGLVEAGILQKRVEGRQTYFQADPNCPFVPELTGLLRKLVGTPIVLEQILKPVRSKIDCAFIYGSIARGDENSSSDIDLMVIGELGLGDLVSALRKGENKLGRQINPTIYPASELARRFKEGHHFVLTVLNDPAKIFVVGSASELETALNPAANKSSSDEQGRAGRATGRRRVKA